MTLAELTFALFTVSNIVRIVGYLPQIARLQSDTTGAAAISILTWSIFLVAHTSVIAYAIVNLCDVSMALIFCGNAIGCGTVVGLSIWKRWFRNPARVAA